MQVNSSLAPSTWFPFTVLTTRDKSISRSHVCDDDKYLRSNRPWAHQLDLSVMSTLYWWLRLFGNDPTQPLGRIGYCQALVRSSGR